MSKYIITFALTMKQRAAARGVQLASGGLGGLAIFKIANGDWLCAIAEVLTLIGLLSLTMRVSVESQPDSQKPS